MYRRTGSELPSAMYYSKTVAVGVRRSRFLVRCKTREANKTVRSTMKLRSNITRRTANKTAECPYEHSADR